MQQMMIGDYRVIATLGRGGMADVFLAVRRSLVGFTKLIVIKKLRSDLAQAPDGPKYRELLLDEARLAARLQHPNIVQAFEVGEFAGEPFLAMEYLDGQALNHVIGAAQRAHVPIPQELALCVVADTLRALAYAHDLRDFDGSPLNIVHRDVSPQNIFLTYAGEVKLVDFGVAKFSLSPETEAGVVKGKAAYMAPEQASGDPIDRRADIFATGIVLWELLAGKRLMRSESAAAALRQLLFEPMPSLLTVRNDIDPNIARICATALERDLQHRYASAAEMAADIESALEASGRARNTLPDFLELLFGKERRELDTKIRAALANETEQAAIASASQLPSFASASGVSGIASVSSQSQVTSQSQLTASSGMSNATAVAPKPRSEAGIFVLLGCTVLIVVAGVARTFWARLRPATITATSTTSSPSSIAPSGDPDLRLCGSNTVGAELAPALVEAFLAKKSSAPVSRAAGATPDELFLTTSIAGAPLVVQIDAKGTATAFDGLASGACDIGMASRAVSDAEAARLSQNYGDLRSPATEHVIALDGIAVVVNQNNRVRSLDRSALHDLFDGKTQNWSAVGGDAGPVNVFARDKQSGTFDTFKALVLGNDDVPATARRFAESDALSDAVASDASSIGFIGLAYVGSAKAIAIGDTGMLPMLPNSFTVTTEDYMLARRLYFYTTPKPRTPLVADLVTFAISAQGQAVARQKGFVDLSIVLKDAESCVGRCPPRYTSLTTGAQRLSLDFRFRPKTGDLDSRAARDLDRVVTFLRDYPNASLMLFGFSDVVGDGVKSVQLSKDRAQSVARELAMRGIRVPVVEGFGAAMPITAGTSDSDRDRNRRVEVWIKH
jgi:phosphate transport system substrate-binding protein